MNNQRKLNSIERLAVEPQRKKRRYTKRKVDKRLTKRQFYFRHCGQCLNKFEEMTDQSSGNAFKEKSTIRHAIQIEANLYSTRFRLQFCQESVTLRGFWLCCFSRQNFKWNRWLLINHYNLYLPRRNT